MSLSLAIFLVGVLDGYFLIHEVLAIHVGNSVVRCFKGGERDEAVAL